MRNLFGNQLIILAVAFFSCQHSVTAFTFVDPVGDTYAAGPDINELVASVTDTSVNFSITFEEPVIAPSSGVGAIVGYLDIDIDQNQSTGLESHQSGFSPTGSSSLGIEYYLDFFSEQFSPDNVEVVNAATNLPVGLAPVSFEGSTILVELPLDLIEQDSALNYGVVFGSFNRMTDEATNPGESPATTVPEPTSAALWLLSALALFHRYVRKGIRE